MCLHFVGTQVAAFADGQNRAKSTTTRAVSTRLSCRQCADCIFHNKMVLVDLGATGKYVHVGAINGGEASNKANRGMALLARSDASLDRLYQMGGRAWTNQPPLRHLLIGEVMYRPSDCPLSVGGSDYVTLRPGTQGYWAGTWGTRRPSSVPWPTCGPRRCAASRPGPSCQPEAWSSWPSRPQTSASCPICEFLLDPNRDARARPTWCALIHAPATAWRPATTGMKLCCGMPRGRSTS